MECCMSMKHEKCACMKLTERERERERSAIQSIEQTTTTENRYMTKKKCMEREEEEKLGEKENYVQRTDSN